MQEYCVQCAELLLRPESHTKALACTNATDARQGNVSTCGNSCVFRMLWRQTAHVGASYESSQGMVDYVRIIIFPPLFVLLQTSARLSGLPIKVKACTAHEIATSTQSKDIITCHPCVKASNTHLPLKDADTTTRSEPICHCCGRHSWCRGWPCNRGRRCRRIRLRGWRRRCRCVSRYEIMI